MFKNEPRQRFTSQHPEPQLKDRSLLFIQNKRVINFESKYITCTIQINEKVFPSFVKKAISIIQKKLLQEKIGHKMFIKTAATALNFFIDSNMHS